MNEMRIQKYLSECGVMSRRNAEDAIRHGRVTVNGERAVIGQKIISEIDEIICDGIRVTARKDKKIYIMLYKPAGVVTTMSDENGRLCTADILRAAGVETRVYPIGRLDMYSEGLLLLTNDGETANKLMHPKHDISKMYHVTIKGELDFETIENMTLPIDIDGRMTKPINAKVIERKNGKTKLRLELFEGRNRQIRRICENLDLVILKLKRVCVGNINIGTLKPSQWKHLNHTEIEYLKGL